MFKSVEVKLNKVSKLKDLSIEVSSLLDNTNVQSRVEKLLLENYFDNLVYFRDPENSQHPSYMYERSSDVIIIHKESGEYVKNILPAMLDDDYDEYGEVVRELTTTKFSKNNGFSEDYLDEVYYNYGEFLVQKFAMYGITTNHSWCSLDYNVVNNTILYNLYTPIAIDKDQDIFIIGIYDVSVLADDSVFMEDERFSFANVLYEPKIIPKGAIIYSNKHKIRYYNHDNDVKIENRLFLPHNIKGYKNILSDSPSYEFENLFMIDKDEAEYIYNNPVFKSFMNYLKNSLPSNDKLIQVLNVNRSLSGAEKLAEDALKDPTILFADYRSVDYIALLRSLKNIKSFDKNTFNINNASNYYSNTSKELLLDIQSYINDNYSIVKLEEPEDTDGLNVYCNCGNIISEKINTGDLIQDKDFLIKCEKCSNIYSLNSDYIYEKLSGESYSIHRFIDNDWIDFNDMSIKQDVKDSFSGFDLLDPLMIKENFSSYSIYGNDYIEIKTGFFVNDEVKDGNSQFPITRAFFTDLEVDENNEFRLVNIDEYVSVNSKEYFHYKYTSIEKEPYDVKRLTPHQFSKTLDNSQVDLICIDKERTEYVFSKYDKYNTIDYYIDLMGVKKGSNEYYEAMALLEGKFANYLNFFPQIELLMKSEYKNIAKDIFEESVGRSEIRKLFNLKETKPKNVCKLNNPNIFVKKSFYTLDDLREINYIQYIAKSTKVNLGKITEYTTDMFSTIEDISIVRRSISDVLESLEGLDIEIFNVSEVVEYAGRCHEVQCMELDEFGYLWKDYVKMANDLNYDLLNKDVLYPDSLKREHDIAMKLYEKVSNSLEKKKFKDIVSKESYKDLEYRKGGYAIIAPYEAKDLIDEGVSLNHCVASYVSTVANERSKILFLRRVDELEKSLYTIEIRDGFIVQARGAYNKSILSDLEAYNFLKLWADDKDLTVQI